MTSAFDKLDEAAKRMLEASSSEPGSAFGIPRPAPNTADLGIAPLQRRESPRARHRRRTAQAAGSTSAQMLREFEDWANGVYGEDASGLRTLLASLVDLLHGEDLDLSDPEDVDPILDLVFEFDDDVVVDGTLDLLHDYVHFRLDTSDDPRWTVAHDLVEDSIGDGDPDVAAIEAMLDEVGEVSPEQQRAALARLPIVSAVPEFLRWVDRGRPITPSGSLLRADFEPVAAMLGVRALGVNRRPSIADADLGVQYALTMSDVPAVAAWWSAMLHAELIGRSAGRVKPGADAAHWGSSSDDDLSEMLAAFTIAFVIAGADYRTYAPGERIAQLTSRLLLNALAPELAESDDSDASDPADRHFELDAPARLSTLRALGVVSVDDAGDVVVTEGLGRVVAKAVIIAFSLFDARVSSRRRHLWGGMCDGGINLFRCGCVFGSMHSTVRRLCRTSRIATGP